MNNLYFHSKSQPRVTIAAVIDGQKVKFGAARCSTSDQFNKKRGRQIALGRAKSKNPLAYASIPAENFTKWFRIHSEQIAQEVQKDARLLELTNDEFQERRESLAEKLSNL